MSTAETPTQSSCPALTPSDAPDSEQSLLSALDECKRLQKEILEISDHEQRRIGRDLHDGVCQVLTGLKFLIKVLKDKVADRQLLDTREIEEIGDLVSDALSQADGVSKGLCPVELESSGLMAALSDLAAKTSRIYHVDCRFTHESPVVIQDPSIEIHLYRIAQEAISNALKHARAKHIEISLNTLAEGMMLCVEDDGRPGASHPARAGMGMRIMNYRAAMMGAVLTILPATDSRGTRVHCLLPAPIQASER